MRCATSVPRVCSTNSRRAGRLHHSVISTTALLLGHYVICLYAVYCKYVCDVRYDLRWCLRCALYYYYCMSMHELTAMVVVTVYYIYNILIYILS